MMSLTKRQSVLFDFLKNTIAEKGYCPSYEEIGKHMGISSPATVFKHVRNLEARGYIVCHPGTSRSIEIVEVNRQRFEIESETVLWDKELKCYWTRFMGPEK